MKRRTLSLIFAIIITAACFSGCGILTSANNTAGQDGPRSYQVVWYDSFDTAISMTAYCDSEQDFNALAGEVHEEFLRLHRIFDIYSEHEGLANAATLNRLAGSDAPLEIPAELFNLLLLGKTMYLQTGGNVNIAMGAVLRLWHEAREEGTANPANAHLPAEEALKQAAWHCNIDEVVLIATAEDMPLKKDSVGLNTDPENAGKALAYLADPDMSLDLGAIAKGYAAELVAAKLRSEGRSGILINAGGNVVAIGNKPDGSKWKVAVMQPDENSKDPYADTLSISDMALVTTGVYQRYFEVDGVRYHHVIDKDTLRPENRYLSVTVVCDNSGIADALSTAVFNMKPEEGRTFIESLEGTEALWIMADGSMVASSGWAKLK